MTTNKNKLKDMLYSINKALHSNFVVAYLYDEIYETFEPQLKELKKELADIKSLETNAVIKIAVVGSFSCGKSSFINSIVNEDITPVDINPTTHIITVFSYGEKLVIKNSKGKKITLKEYKEQVQNPKLRGEQFYIEYPCDSLKSFKILDTPGLNSEQINDTDTNDTDLNIRALEIADVIFYLANIEDGTIDNKSIKYLKDISSKYPNKNIYMIFTQSDKKTPNARITVRNSIIQILENKNIKIDGDLIYSSLSQDKLTMAIDRKFFSERKKELYNMLGKLFDNKNEILKYKNNKILDNLEEKIYKLKRNLVKCLETIDVDYYINQSMLEKKECIQKTVDINIDKKIEEYERIFSCYKYKFFNVYNPGLLSYCQVKKNINIPYRISQRMEQGFDQIYIDIFNEFGQPANIDAFWEEDAEKIVNRINRNFHRFFSSRIIVELRKYIDVEQEVKQYGKEKEYEFIFNIEGIKDILNGKGEKNDSKLG